MASESADDHVTKRLTYPGDVVDGMVGRLIGPDAKDRVWFAQSGIYYPDDKVTRVTIRTVSVADLDSAEFDAWGELRGTLRE